jgi:gliding motility-associated-like protein
MFGERARIWISWPVVVLLAWLLPAASSHAQICGLNVPSINVDLSSSPDATFLTPNIQRQGQCCGATNPDQCLQFVITLHPTAQGINFQICAGAVPPGALYYQIGCGPEVQVGQAICLDGAGPHILTFCKPGNNTNQYCITSIPPPTAGPGITLNDGCSGTITSNGFAPGTIQWTSVAPGVPGAYNSYLNCPTCPNTTVTGQTGAPAYVDYQVCGNAIAPCSSNSYCDTVRVYFNPTLTVAIVPALPTVCFGAAGTTITALGAGGTPPYSFQWNTGATTQSIFVGPGTYSVLMTDATDCPPTSTEVQVTQFAQPIQALPGDDILVCGQAANVTLNGTVTGASGGVWSGGSGTFTPSSTTLNAVYTPTQAEMNTGSVQLTLTTTGNGTCPGDAATLNITFATPFEDVGIAATDASCANSADGAVSVSPTLPGWAYAWSHAPTLNAPTATGLTAGNYAVTVTDLSGCVIQLEAVVNAPAPLVIADITTTDESCAGVGDGNVSVTIAGGTGPYSYLWSNGATTSTISVGAGTYSVLVTDANGCTAPGASATVIATGQPNIAHAGPDLVGCLNALPVQLNGSVTNATGGVWSGGNGAFLGTGLNVSYQPTVQEILAGGVDLVLTTTGNTSCPPGMDMVHVALSNAFLNASLTGTDVLCHGGNTGTATFLPANTSFSYVWTAPANTVTNFANGLSAGTYSVTVTDALGCDTVMTIAIAEPAPVVAGIGSATDPLCSNSQNGSVTGTANGGIPPYSFNWSPNTGGQNSATANGLDAGWYAVMVTDANGCSDQAGTQLTAPPPVQLSAQVPDTVCVNAPITLTASTNGGQGDINVVWSGIGTGNTVTHSFSVSQTVTVTATDSAGCLGPVLTFLVNVLDLQQATLTAYGDTTVCPAGSAQIGATLTGYPGPYVLTWSGSGLTGGGPFQIPVSGNMTMTVVATDACEQSLEASVTLGLDVPPVVQLPAIIAEGCAPLTVTMPNLGLGSGISYQWSFGNGNTSQAVSPTHTYAAGQFQVGLTVVTATGCTSTAASTGQVIAYAPPTAAFTANPWSTDIDHATITFDDQSSNGIVVHAWDLGDGSTSTVQDPVHQYTDIGEYPVELWVQDAKGCVDSVTHIVRITPVHDITIPNAFTPDPNGGNGGSTWIPGDLSNDVFYPFARFVKDFRMRIFNRWGELIFESSEHAIGWDGWYRGQMSPQDAYVYQVWVRFVDDKEIMRMGDVTLMR